jgi:hypothetical protein
MAESNRGTDGEWTPPYIAWRTLLNLFEKLESNQPPQIDKTFLSGSNQSRTQTMNALKSLELIEEDGSLTPAILSIVEAGTERPKAVRELLSRFFEEPIRLGSVNGTQQQLDQAFSDYGISGSTLRKAASFYLKAAAYAELPLSPNFKTPSRTRTKSSTPRKRRPKAPKNGTDGGGASRNASASGDSSLATLKTRYIEMLMQRAEEQDDLDDSLLDRIEGLLGMESGQPDEDRED